MAIDLLDGFRIGNCEVEPALGVVERPDGAQALSPQAMEMLVRLAKSARNPVSREALVAEIWDGESVDEVSIQSCIDELQSALANPGNKPSYLEIAGDGSLRLTTSIRPIYEQLPRRPLANFWRELNRREVLRVSIAYWALVWALLQSVDFIIDLIPEIPSWSLKFLVVLAFVGFPIVIASAWVFKWTPSGPVADDGLAEPSSKKLHRTDYVIVGAALIALTVYLFDTRSGPGPPGPGLQITTIAVLPFDNLTGNPNDQNISDGIVEELLNELARLKELRVVGRKASFYYRTMTEDWQTIADKLGANMIVEGSIRRSDGTIRVAAQLIDRSGFHLWSDTYDAKLDNALDILAVQRGIAQQVADALPIQFSEESRRSLERIPTISEDAFQLYLQGRNYLRDADRMQDYESAEILFRDALELDPKFIDAQSGLCETQIQVYQRTQRPQAYASAAASCARLVSQDELNAEAFVALGNLHRFSGNHEDAKSAFERALTLSPNYEPALYGMARAVEALGNYEEAERYYKLSEEVDPGYWQVYIGYGTYLERGGRVLEGIEKYKQALRLAPDNLAAYTNLGAAYLDLDRWDEAADAFQSVIDIEPDPIGYMNLGTVQYLLQNYKAAEQYFRDGIAMWDEFYPLWGKLGNVLESQGRLDESRAAFENAEQYARAVIDVNSSDARAMYYLASYLAHLGNLEEARKWADKSTGLSPQDSSAHYFSAIVASLAGDDDLAIDELAKSLELGYSSRIARHDKYFQDYWDSAKLSEWMLRTDQ